MKFIVAVWMLACWTGGPAWAAESRLSLHLECATPSKACKTWKLPNGEEVHLSKKSEMEIGENEVLDASTFVEPEGPGRKGVMLHLEPSAAEAFARLTRE